MFFADMCLVEVARGLAGMQESLCDCKKPQEGTVLSVFSFFVVFNLIYIHAHINVCICVYLETAWFLHFICGKSIFYFSSYAP